MAWARRGGDADVEDRAEARLGAVGLDVLDPHCWRPGRRGARVLLDGNLYIVICIDCWGAGRLPAW
jgi:hypothetical protein